MYGNYLPPNPLIEWIGRTALKLMGWRIEGELPRLDKFVAIGAHHTSNWDFILMLGIAWDLGLKVKYLGKHTLFKPPFGFVTRSDPVRMTLGDLGAIAGFKLAQFEGKALGQAEQGEMILREVDHFLVAPVNA